MVVDVNVNNVVFMEFFSPSVWNSVLYLILKLLNIGLFTQRLTNALLMQLIKFVVKLSDHLLDVLSLFLLVELVDYCLLDVPLCVP